MAEHLPSPTHLRLQNSQLIPRLGLGTFRSKGEEVRRAVQWALDCGYRLVDTASIYKNEVEIGQALRESGVERENVFLTSKISPFEQGYDSALKAVGHIIDRLGCGYLDLCLIHWPGVAKMDVRSRENAELRRETWQALEKLYDEGKCRAIGVSNYTEDHLKLLLNHCVVKPMVNQVEVHPYLCQESLRRVCAQQDIVVQAYSSLGCGHLLQDSDVCAMASRYSRTPAQILLRWGIQNNLVVLPRSVNKDRIRLNSDVFSFSLLREDMTLLNELERDHHFCWSSSLVL